MTQKKIALIMCSEEREKNIMQRIKKAVHELSPHSEVMIYAMEHNYNFIERMVKFKPDVILTFPLANKSISQLYYIVKRRLKCVLLCLRTEGFINNEDLVEVFAGLDRYDDDLVDYEIFWGSRMAKLVGNKLLEQNKLSCKSRIKIFGYPQYEFFNDQNHDWKNNLYEDIRLKISSFTSQNTLFFVTGFSFADYTVSDMYRAGDLDMQNSMTDYISLRDGIKIFRDKWIQNIKQCAKEHKNLLFIVKNHPMEVKAMKFHLNHPYKELQNIDNILLLGNETSSMELIQNSAVLLHYGSTVAAESFICQKPSALLVDDEIFEPLNIKGFFVTNLPYSIKEQISNLDLVIEKYKKGNLFFEHNDEIKSLLKNDFNIIDIKNYKPSYNIAEFILSDIKPQHIKKQSCFLKQANKKYKPRLRTLIKVIRSFVPNMTRG